MTDHDYVVGKAYRRWAISYDWDWVVTLTFPPEREFDRRSRNVKFRVRRILFDWLRIVQTGGHLQVGAFYAICFKYDFPHVQLLMVGRGNKGRVKLSSLDTQKYKNAWPWAAKVERPDSNAAVSKYFASHTLRKQCRYYSIGKYNTKLLKKLRVFPLQRL